MPYIFLREENQGNEDLAKIGDCQNKKNNIANLTWNMSRVNYGPFLIALKVWHICFGHNGNTELIFVLDNLRHFVGSTCQQVGIDRDGICGDVIYQDRSGSNLICNGGSSEGGSFVDTLKVKYSCSQFL